MVLRIFSQIGIVGYSFLNPLNQPWALEPNALIQLIFESCVTCRSSSSSPSPTSTTGRAAPEMRLVA